MSGHNKENPILAALASGFSPEISEVGGHVVQLQLEGPELEIPRLLRYIFRSLCALIPAGSLPSAAAVHVRQLGMRRRHP